MTNQIIQSYPHDPHPLNENKNENFFEKPHLEFVYLASQLVRDLNELRIGMVMREKVKGRRGHIKKMATRKPTGHVLCM